MFFFFLSFPDYAFLLLLIGWAYLLESTFKLYWIKESNNVSTYCFVSIRRNISSKLWVENSILGILFNSHLATGGESRMLSTWTQAIIYMYHPTVDQE